MGPARGGGEVSSGGVTREALARGVIVALGLACVAVLIWYLGPLVAIGSVAPLVSETARWAAIGSLALIMALVWVLWSLRAARTNRQLLDAIATPGADEAAVLGQRFAEAVDLLRSSTLGDERSFAAKLVGRHFVYELPWYLIIGAPGSGKTTALEASGLEFPLAKRLGHGAVRGVGGTRNCDWWFAADAVLIDTAGRYTTQDSDRALDAKAWGEFIRLLARYRPQRPLNGVLLAISASDLLIASETERTIHAGRLRERIDELHETLGIRVPIYVLVTKIDLVPGFVEFFGDIGPAERAQVWGATFPFIATPQGSAGAASPLEALPVELTRLEQRLNDRMMALLRRPADRQRHAAIYQFPQHWHLLKDILCAFLETTFATASGAPGALTPMVRGVYFTSGTQEGSPIDRALGGLGRALGLARSIVPPDRASAKSFFVTRLLKEVVFAEAELAGTNRQWEQRRSRLQWAAIGGIVLVVAGLLVAGWQAERASVAYLASIAPRVESLAREAGGLKALAPTDIVGLVPLLDQLEGLQAKGLQAKRDDQAVSRAVSNSLAPDFDQAERIGAAAGDAYRRTLRNGFLPRIAARLEAQMRSATTTDRVYEALKAYLMLFGGRNFNRDMLRDYLHADWSLGLPAQVGDAERASLRRHLDALLAGGEVGAPAQADAKVIERARALVAKTSLRDRVYDRLRQGAPQETGWSVSSVAGEAATIVFARTSGQSLERGVPKFFTAAGYREGFGDRVQTVARQISAEESWVLGGAGAAANPERLADEVAERYFADYAKTWVAFLQDIQLAPSSGLDQTAAIAGALARPDSPLLRLLGAIARELAVGRPGGTVDSKLDALRRALAGQELQDSVAMAGRLQTYLIAVEDAAKRKTVPPTNAIAAELSAAAARYPEPASRVLQQLATLSNIQVLDVLRGSVAQQFAAEVVAPCAKLVAGRYPLVRTSRDDMSQADFAATFGTGALIDGFFQKHLAAHVDTGGARWRYKSVEGRSIGENPETLLMFERARAIRDAFFAEGGKSMVVRMELRLLELDPSIAQFTLEIDGQTLSFGASSRGPRLLQWPGPGGGPVRLQLTPASPSNPSGYVFEGPWALFHLLDRVRSEPSGTPNRQQLVFDIEGRRARFEASGLRGPLAIRLPALEAFQCPKGL